MLSTHQSKHVELHRQQAQDRTDEQPNDPKPRSNGGRLAASLEVPERCYVREINVQYFDQLTLIACIFLWARRAWSRSVSVVGVVSHAI